MFWILMCCAMHTLYWWTKQTIAKRRAGGPGGKIKRTKEYMDILSCTQHNFNTNANGDYFLISARYGYDG